MIKKNLPLFISTGLLLLSIGYIIYLKQESFGLREQAMDARIEALEYKGMAEREAQKAEMMAAKAIEAETMAQRALGEAKRQTELALDAMQKSK